MTLSISMFMHIHFLDILCNDILLNVSLGQNAYHLLCIAQVYLSLFLTIVEVTSVTTQGVSTMKNSSKRL